MPPSRLRIRRGAALACMAAATALAPAAHGALGGGEPIVIDDFSTPQGPLTVLTGEAATGADSAVFGAGILGARRALAIARFPLGTQPEGTVQVVEGALTALLQTGDTITSSWVGPAGPPFSLTPPVDLTAGGSQDALHLRFRRVAGFGARARVDLMSGTSPTLTREVTLLQTVAPEEGAGETPLDLVFPFAELGPDGDTAARTIAGVRVFLQGGSDLRLESVTTDALLRADLTAALILDRDGDGRADPGDRFRLTATLDNPEDFIRAGARDVVLALPAPEGSRLIAGSVTAGEGIAELGNAPADTAARVSWAGVGDGAPATEMRADFEVTGAARDPLMAQGTVASRTLTSLLTDDPALPGRTDPTPIPVDPNTAPTAGPTTFEGDGTRPLVVVAPGVLTGASDADGQPLTAVLDEGPRHGALALTADGGFTYTPNPGFSGTDVFRIRASDGFSTSAPAEVTVLTRTPSTAPALRCSGRPVTIVALPGVVTRGTRGPDVILGTAGADTIVSGGGDDVVCGLGGDDRIVTGAGDDRVLGGPGDDRIDTGAGNDIVAAGRGDDTVLTRAGRDVIGGGPGDDLIVPGTGADRVSVGPGDDIVRLGGDATTAIDRAVGGTGRDTVLADRRDVVSGFEVVRRGRR